MDINDIKLKLIEVFNRDYKLHTDAFRADYCISVVSNFNCDIKNKNIIIDVIKELYGNNFETFQNLAFSHIIECFEFQSKIIKSNDLNKTLLYYSKDLIEEYSWIGLNDKLNSYFKEYFKNGANK